MGMTRAAALTYIQEQGYGPLETLTSTTSTDNAAGYKGAIDDAALALGVSFEDLAAFEVASTKTVGFRAALRYYALRRHANVLRSMLSATEIGDAIRQAAALQFPMVLEGMAEAAKEAAGQGVVVGDRAGDVVSLDTLHLDIYEPAVEEV